jgi:chromosome segregation protein
VHLKSLTLRGFKSFASATTLRFEPGITCVVGPNGSGKSNVVDALSWVMGEQGAKSLRGGKMEDVIFAGTAGRAPLGRAEVSLTIDNADGALPIDYAEVTVTRTMFRNGGSDYAINGSACRLLDVQELLSDSGIGREMHVIVGQGQLDAVLAASAEDRRGFIEEAAGVLKHRKRKEKALRKLDAMEGNLTRLHDLTAELRRQLGPLGRQAEVARRATTVQADARDARLRLLADDLLALTEALEVEAAAESTLRQRRAAVEADLAAATREEVELEAAARDVAVRGARAQEVYYRLASAGERLRGTAGLAAERVRLSAVPEDDRSGRAPEDLEEEAVRVRASETELSVRLTRARRRLEAAATTREAAEEALAAEERRLAALRRAAADRREGLARLAGQVAGRRSRVEAGQAESGRLRAALDEALQRAEHARGEFAALEARVAGLDEDEVALDAEHDAAAAELAEVDATLTRLRACQQEVERERAAAAARRDALEMGLAGKDGAAALLTAPERPPGLLGSVATALVVDEGWETAVAAALGWAADAVAVDGVGTAVEAIELLKDREAGRAGLLLAGAPVQPRDDPDAWPALPAGARWALSAVRAPAALEPALRRLLRGVALVEDLARARALVVREPLVVAVTREGDLLGTSQAAGGSAGALSLLEVRAAAEEAVRQVAEAAHRGERLRFAVIAAERQRAGAAERLVAALGRLHESDARHAALAERLGELGGAVRAATGEAERLSQSMAAADEQLAADRAELEKLQRRLSAAQRTGEAQGEARGEARDTDAAEPATDERDRLSAAGAAARAEEVEARLAVRTTEERTRGLRGRAEGLDLAARQEREVRERAAARRARRAREASVAEAVAAAARTAAERLARSLATAAAARQRADQARTALEERLRVARSRIRELDAQLDELTDSVHRDEVARAEQRLRVETLQRRAIDELGVDPTTLVEEYGPHRPVPVPPTEGEGGGPDGARPFVRAEQEKRLRAAERALARLGKVNPLALEEFAALEERHAFLVEQLADMKATRRDLLDIVREVDERVEQVFTEAFHDTAREFEQVFARLFPGGEGRLALTDPTDLHATGVDVEARPAGKRVKRLSLLSGGERSLTAVALLVAIFRARPSPFYVLDEVEATLDDTNLGRLLGILDELREASQLIVITHQKRTMEIADALYGLSMRGDGVTTVIGQRLREAEPA